MQNLTIIVPFFNGHGTIDALLQSIPADIPTIIVDDQSDTPLVLERDNTIVLHSAQKGYFSGACNIGIRACDTDVLVLNQDVELRGTEWLNILAEKRDAYATIGDAVMQHPAWPHGYVQGTFMFIRRDAWQSVGEFNVRDYPLWGATAEWQVRACRAGYKALPIYRPSWLVHRREQRCQFGTAITTALAREPDKQELFIRTPPLISVVIPCYNYGRYLQDCVNSFIGGPQPLGNWQQTLQSFELIIVDDASTDGETSEIVREMEDGWRGIRTVLLPKNRGTPGCINAGVGTALGKYIYICSADDMLEASGLDTFYRTCLQNAHSFAYSDVAVFTNGERRRILKMREYNFDALLRSNYISAGIMYPLQAWKDVGGYLEEMVYGREEWGFVVGLGVHGWCGVHIKEPLYLYRREGLNRSFSNANKYRGDAARKQLPDNWVKGDIPDGVSQSWKEFFRNQIKARYPEIFRGEREMGCCGGGRTNSSKNKTLKGLPGAEGMAIIEYIGKNAGDVTWIPDVEPYGVRYRIGGSTRRRYVDNRHLAWFLSLRKDRSPLFREHILPAESLPSTAPGGAKELSAPGGAKELSAPDRAEELSAPDRAEELSAPGGAEELSAPGGADDLTDLPGIGLSKAQALQRAGYDSFKAILEADVADLACVEGISIAVARKIQEVLSE